MHRRISRAVVVALAIFVTNCGGGSATPTGPSSSGSSTSATISGSVRSGATFLASSTGNAMPGLTVTVAGTNISSAVDVAGQFTLRGVPAGDVELVFTAPGVNSTLRVSQVKPSESITINVNVVSGSVVVDSEVRSTSGEEQIEGRVESVPPTMTANTIKVAGRVVKTDAATRIEQGGTTRAFADLLIGMRVHVRGTPSGSDLLASRIQIQNTNPWLPVNVNGVIDTLSGDATLFSFKVGSRLVKGDSLTEWFGTGNTAGTFSLLQNGVRVEVKGQQRDDYVYAERIHVNTSDDDDDDDDGQDSSASIQGTLTAMSGTRPNLTLTVTGTTVRTSAGTEVKRRGDVQTLAELQVGMTVHVIGTRQSDGSLDARRIEIRDDEVGDPVEIEGSVGGLKGTCPAVTFGINGFDVVTNASTTFAGGTCVALKNGDRVKVKGTRQGNGSFLATSVTR